MSTDGQDTNAVEKCRKLQPPEHGARALLTDDRQTDGRQQLAFVSLMILNWLSNLSDLAVSDTLATVAVGL